MADCGTVIHPDGPRDADQERRGAGLRRGGARTHGVRPAERLAGQRRLLPGQAAYAIGDVAAALSAPTRSTSRIRRARWAPRASVSRCWAARGVGAAVRDLRCAGRPRVQPHAGDAGHDRQPPGGPAAAAQGRCRSTPVGEREHVARHDAAVRALPARHAGGARRAGRRTSASDGWIVAGGQDSYDWFKNRAKRTGRGDRPHRYRGAQGHSRNRRGPRDRRADHADEIASTMHWCSSKYRLLAAAAGRVASPQIRNAGTLGGNLCQDTRCWYYRSRRGLLSRRRQHVLRRHAGGPEPRTLPLRRQLAASRCRPPTRANALVALDARMVISAPGGERVVPAEEFFIGPAVDIRRMTVLKPGEILTAVRLPEELGAGAASTSRRSPIAPPGTSRW